MDITEFTFSFILAGRFSAEEEMELTEQLIDAGCDYPEVYSCNDIVTVQFYAEDGDHLQLIKNEIEKIQSVGVSISCIAESDEVSVSDIAKRSSITKMTISRYARQMSGAEDFPLPDYGEKWSWAEVADWLHKRGKVPAVYVNRALALRDIGNAIKIQKMLYVSSVQKTFEQLKKAPNGKNSHPNSTIS